MIVNIGCFARCFALDLFFPVCRCFAFYLPFLNNRGAGQGCMSGDIKMLYSTLWCSLSFQAQASDQGEFFFRTMVGLSGARA